MKKLRFLTVTFLVGLALLQSAGASPHPSGRNGTHSHGVIDDWGGKRYSDQYPNRRYARSFAANLNVGEPRTVRMIYFLPNDRPYRADVVQRMKAEILNIQTFFAEQMEAHGYGRRTFRVETDVQGEPIVHRVAGKHPDSHYLDITDHPVFDEVFEAFDFYANVYLIVIDNSIDGIGLGDGRVFGGVGGRWGKNGGGALVPGGFRFETTAHELGHAFGLQHDFQDGAYIMSYGSDWSGSAQPDRKQLSLCHAENLLVHPYFNPNIPIEEGDRPYAELISPHSYPSDSKSVSIRVRVSDPDGLHQVILHAIQPDNRSTVKQCRGLEGRHERVIEFDYDGVIPSAHDPAYSRSTSLLSPLVHEILIEAVDAKGEAGENFFALYSDDLQPLSKISGDNQQSIPNTPLPTPFVVELRDLNDGSARREVPVTFTVIAGGGTLSVEHVKTDFRGRAESTLTLGPRLGENRVEVSAEGLTVTFNAVAGAAVEILDKNLRAAVENTLSKMPGQPIAPVEIATLTRLDARNTNIRDLTGLEHATNLTELNLGGNNLSNISTLAGLTNLRYLWLWDNNISDISPVARLTDLIELVLPSNAISDIAPVVGLTNLTGLWLGNNRISDISPLVANTGLGSGDRVFVNGNPLSYQSIHTHIPALQSRGVTVEFTPRTPASPLVISGDNQQGAPGAALERPLVVEVRDRTGTPFAGVPVVFTVAEGDGTLRITTSMTDANGRAESTLTLGPRLGENRVEVSAEGLTVTFNAVAGAAVEILDKNLRAAVENTLSKMPGQPIAPAEIATLTRLDAPNANISDLTGLEFATNLTNLVLWDNNISDISAVVGLTNLTELSLGGNSVTDISPVADLTNLTSLHLPGNPVADISLVTGLTNLTYLNLSGVNISDLSPVVGLTELTVLWLQHNNISDLSPLVENTGLGNGDAVYVDGNPLSYTSINTHIPTLRERGVLVSADNLKPPTLEYLLSVPVGLNLIHVPLKVTAVDGVAKTIGTISDLYDALGGADAVNFLMTYDTSTQGWLTYFGVSERGTANDKTLTDQMGILADIKAPTSVRLTGNPLGNNGSSTIGLNQGLNLVGLPLRDSRINRVSDLLRLDGIQGNGPVVIVTVDGDFKSVGRADDLGDIPITGGQGFLLTVQRATTVTLSGEGWTNDSATAAPPLIALTGLPVRHTTAVLALEGEIVDEVSAVNPAGFRVAVKNLSMDSAAVTRTSPDETGYRLTIVDIETARAAQVGDTLEISAQSTNPFIGVKPLRYTVTAEDVLQGWIQLPALVVYEIPTETELLANYPNPFNPETWIPYRLAEDAFVTLDIYDQSGHAVRTIDVGHRVAAVYERRSKAIYWDGRNEISEQVASGIYFYHLSAGDYSQTRKMLILK